MQREEPRAHSFLTLRWAIGLLAALALLARLAPVNYGSPEPGYFSSDEIDAVSRGMKFARGLTKLVPSPATAFDDLLPLHANKPTHYAQVLAGMYGVKFALARARGATLQDFEREFFLAPFSFYRLARLASVGAAMATLALLAWALRCHSRGSLLVALTIFALAPSSVRYAHIAKEDTLATLWTFAAFVAAVESFAASSLSAPVRRRWLLISAASAGLAVSTKYNCFFAALFPLLAWLGPRPRLWRDLAAIALVGIAAFLLGTPAPLVAPNEFLRRTLGSHIVSEVGHGLASLEYAHRYGLAFFAEIWWVEFGVALAFLAVGLAWMLRRAEPALRICFAVPVALYIITLAFAGHLDYQYVIVLTPVFAWVAGQVWGATESWQRSQRWRLALGALLGIAFLQNGYLVAQRTASYLGGDTRLDAGQWLREQAKHDPELRSRPLLIASAFYYHYYPALAFTPATYEKLAAARLAEGATGEFLQKAAFYAREDTRPLFDADFLDVKVHFYRQPDGTRRFLPQPYPLQLDAYAGRHSLIIVPENTFRYLELDPPEAAEVVAFYRAIRNLPLRTEFRPQPWRKAGPHLWIFEAPAASDHPTTPPLPSVAPVAKALGD
ncbi:MAG: hypothetical protein D6691_09480 [Candidatus Hydrogenedentota bacterium]|jgi:hypothetical protein|uniref:Glycosyltransferase RgtA/B/C/D-like domain-containing protein n=1 Tax=Sumerlaea chitinivorans TaxID=2250252 RepID=A0A2Z4Y8U8_SUMC1|nr:hypothetical protein BRCON_2096 [Candidatus Sumerlaea chitinivorans]MCX7963773.1 hypothetical protein [Candidatus Sumerlaea chitinivorans]RMH25557.1 MAG: hypothetical protein D6691_09480 [Candidatus Hydrogenedentota bacterium]